MAMKNAGTAVGLALVLVAVYALAFGNPLAAKPPKIEMVCQASGYAAACTFTNRGGRGAACGKAIFSAGADATETTQVCSGELAANTSSPTVQALFLDHAAVDRIAATPGAGLTIATSQ